MIEHYSHVDAAEKQQAVAKVIRLVRTAQAVKPEGEADEATDPVADRDPVGTAAGRKTSVILGGAGQS